MKSKRLIVIIVMPLAIAGLCYLKILHDESVVRWRSDCISNLNFIAGAKGLAAQELGLKPGALVDTQTVSAYMIGGWRKCPAGGTYTINPIGKEPKCSIPGHSLHGESGP